MNCISDWWDIWKQTINSVILCEYWFIQFIDSMKCFIYFFFQLSDVEDDGYTAFPNLGFNAPVEKGAALVFQNLHKTNGSLNELTFHGSCPILKGDKWGQNNI